jgi:superfamily II DNA or RNA helicase
MAQESQPLLSGTLVAVRGERWRVVESIEHEQCAVCKLIGAAGSNLGVTRSLILPFDRPQPVRRAPRWTRVGRRRWVLALRALLASDAAAVGLRGAADARLDLMEYQVEPALASAHGALRLLIADEVGLGKTVQAALILADLCARTDSARALVLCPAGLCGQWQRELADRFGLRAAVVDLAALRDMFRRTGPESTPWDRLPLAIASIDFVKQSMVLQGMAHIRWDLLVVDEAHLSAVAPERAAAVNWLARRSRRVVLLTATPHPGDPHAFDSLCAVGRLAGEEPIVMFRRTRAGLGLPADRRVKILSVRVSPAERRLHRALRRYAAHVWRAGGGRATSADARLAMVVLAKRAASGPGPLLASLERRLRHLGRLDDPGESQLLLPLGEADTEGADEEPGAILAAPGLTSRSAELEVLENLVDLARTALPFDSKVRALCRLLRRAREPAIVFTEYRDALVHVQARLPAGAEAAVIHGGLDGPARIDAVRSFTSGRAPVLLATDAAAHGLNLQARCRLVVDLDLPWNPGRLEQRIGRVDRIGQRRRVHAIHLVARGTTEDAVLGRLTARADCARRSLGEAPTDTAGDVSEVAIAEALFGVNARRRVRVTTGGSSGCAAGPPPGDERHPGAFRRADFSEQARLEVARLGRLRQLRGRGAATRQRVLARLDAAAPWWTRLRLPGARPCGAIALYRADVVDGRGALLEPLLVAIEADTGGSRVPPSAIPLGRLSAAAVEGARERVAAILAAMTPRLSAERERERSLAVVADAVPVLAVQAGLFDRRALRLAGAARERRASLQRETTIRLDDLRLGERLELAEPPRLVLVAFRRGARRRTC